MKIWTGTLLFFLISCSIATETNVPLKYKRLKYGSVYATYIQPPLSVTCGLFAGLFSKLDQVQGAMCYENAYALINQIKDIVDYLELNDMPKFQEVVQMIFEFLISVFGMSKQCLQTPEALKYAWNTVYSVYTSDKKTFWVLLGKNITSEGVDIWNIYFAIVDSWRNGKYYLAGQYFGNIIYDMFCQGMGNKSSS
eukprot:TRINITY_DN22868_c0_g2_i1.p1 TRINITY_DN22868_c0_g2~~TRINITY_DN22868_c0_g2_i1.p1  ORF type:complete len:195 (-),score=20.95 TRINITY_DN22868_c0_g2_i1:51-635(-)